MSNGFWNQDEGDFRDVPDEVNEENAPPVSLPSQPRAQRPVPQAPVHVQEEPEIDYDPLVDLEEDDEDDYSAVLSDARLRLEQGRLYEMIMNHDLFDGLDADPKAVKAVQRQIRKFAKEQMEIMLGMRKETAKIERLEIDFPFNAVEVTVLKKLAFAASKGASENSDRYVPEVKRTSEEVPVVAQPRKEGLNRIGSHKPAPVAPVKVTPKPVAQKPAPSKLPQKAAKPIERKPLTSAEAKILAEEGVTREEIEQTFDSTLNKPLHELTADELMRRNAESAKRRKKTVKNPSAMPMPSYEQESMLVQTRLMETAGNNPGLVNVMALLNSQAKK